MVGGYLTFQGIDAKARYHGTVVEDALPVIISAHDDRVEAPQGVAPGVALKGHPIVAGLGGQVARPPRLQPAAAKPDADVVATAGDDPLIVAGQVRQGPRRRLRLRLRAALGTAGLRRPGRATRRSGGRSPAGPPAGYDGCERARRVRITAAAAERSVAAA